MRSWTFLDQPTSWCNFFRRRQDGTEVWRATPPGRGTNTWTAARIEGDEVVAHSWSGFVVRLNLASGIELNSTFVK